MPWEAPITWEDQKLVYASRLREQIAGNLNALKFPPTFSQVDYSQIYQTTSTSFVEISATDFNATLETNGGDVLLILTGVWYRGAGGGQQAVFIDFERNGTRIANGLGTLCELWVADISFEREVIRTITWLDTGLAAGTYTYVPFWRIVGVATQSFQNYGFIARELT